MAHNIDDYCRDISDRDRDILFNIRASERIVDQYSQERAPYLPKRISDMHRKNFIYCEVMKWVMGHGSIS